MLTILRTQFLAFICIYSFNVFIALAAPVSVTPHHLLPRDESPHSYLTHTARDVHLRDNNLPSRAAFQGVLPSDGPRTARRAQNVAERSPQAVGRRGFFSGFKKAIGKIKHAVNRVTQPVRKAANWIKKGAASISNVVSTASKVANFLPIPGVGKVLGGVGKVMNKVQNPIGGAGGAILNKIIKRDDVDLTL